MVPTPPASRPTPADRKTRLFCECGRRAPLPDWQLDERATPDGVREVVTYPDCGRVAVSQSAPAVPA